MEKENCLNVVRLPKKIEEIKQENLDLKKRFELALESQAQMLFERTRAEREAAEWLKAYRSLQDQNKAAVRFSLHYSTSNCPMAAPFR